MNQILEIVYKRTFSGEFLTESDFEDILNILVPEKGLSKYLDEFYLLNESPENWLGSYNRDDKVIEMYKTNILNYLKIKEKVFKNINSFELLFYQNLTMLHILLHEIEHANQRKISCEENNLESFLLNLSNQVEPVYWDELRSYRMEEKLANIKPYEEIDDMLQNLCLKNYRKIKELLEMEKLGTELSGYYLRVDSLISIPLKNYLIRGKKKKEIKKNPNLMKDLSAFLSLDERMRYGFAISKDEFQKKTLKKLKLERKYRRNFHG